MIRRKTKGGHNPGTTNKQPETDRGARARIKFGFYCGPPFSISIYTEWLDHSTMRFSLSASLNLRRIPQRTPPTPPLKTASGRNDGGAASVAVRTTAEGIPTNLKWIRCIFLLQSRNRIGSSLHRPFRLDSLEEIKRYKAELTFDFAPFRERYI